MSDTASESREAGSSSLPAQPGNSPHDTSTGSGASPPRDDQLTVISGRPPIAGEQMSESVGRIIQGKILPGDKLGHFELVEYIGGGGMGRVFRAVDQRLGRTVALKVLAPEHATDKESVQRFHNEAQAAARMDHQNIAGVHYVGEDRNLHFIAFEYVEGVNVRKLVQENGPLSPAEAISYTLQIAEALAHTDGRKIVHRDIKPSNVLITPEGRVKLIDMGLARSTGPKTSDNDLTASGVTLGTFDYISPEQARDPRNADVRSDLYSLGCTLFYMLSGRPPFPEGTVLQKLLQHQGDAPPDIREFRPELPDDFTRVLRKMMEKDPSRRYATPDELTSDLLLLADQVGLNPILRGDRLWAVPAKPTTSALQRHFPWITPVAALVCIVFALDFFWSRADVTLSPMSDSESFADSGDFSPNGSSPPDLSFPAGEGGRSSQTNTPGTSGQGVSITYHVPGEHGSFSSDPDPLEDFLASRFGGGLGLEPLGDGMAGQDRSPWGLDLKKYDIGSEPGLAMEPLAGTNEKGRAEAAVEPGTKRTGLLIVKDDPQGENEFASLNAACSAAANGNTIELCYDGCRVERPINLADLKVTIHSGEGYNPIVVFKPGLEDVDPVKYPRGMFTVTGGQLRLIGLAVEMQVPRELSEEWSLFDIRGGQDVQLQRCSLSISNATDQFLAYHEAAFFRVKPAPGSGGTMADSKPAVTPLAEVELVDTIVRGEAEFLKVEGLQPVRLAWDNGLLVTTEQFLSAEGSQESPKAGEKLEIRLRHVTVVSLSGLCRLTVDGYLAPHQLTTEVHCADSIIMLGDGAALIKQEGECDVEDFRQRLCWFGDRVFYQGVEDYWWISNTDSETLPESMTFNTWKRYWGSEDENLPSHNEVVWRRLPDESLPLHAHVMNDYLLAESTQNNPNPASGAASDGRDVGFLADRLPQLPEPAATVPIQTPGTIDSRKPDQGGGTTDTPWRSVESTRRGASTIVE